MGRCESLVWVIEIQLTVSPYRVRENEAVISQYRVRVRAESKHLEQYI